MKALEMTVSAVTFLFGGQMSFDFLQNSVSEMNASGVLFPVFGVSQTVFDFLQVQSTVSAVEQVVWMSWGWSQGLRFLSHTVNEIQSFGVIPHVTTWAVIVAVLVIFMFSVEFGWLE